ncbi:MAG: cyclic nucleotide-binding domain-containing protein [Alphaproteobacteria bacterium]|nr:cyclic nucleotide-binding domain-containing protein [Alphaproteobacteria bacterium]
MSNSIHERRFIPKDTLVIKEGEDGSSAFLLLSGKVEVFSQYDGKETVLATLTAGQIFGEMALVFDEKRTASVRAVENCNVIVITREALKQKLSKSDPTVKAIVEMLSRRIFTANSSHVKRQKNIDELADGANVVYQTVLSHLPENRQDDFKADVLPKLKAFLSAIEKFKDSV